MLTQSTWEPGVVMRCERCHRPFVARRLDRVYCSWRCRQEARAARLAARRELELVPDSR